MANSNFSAKIVNEFMHFVAKAIVVHNSSRAFWGSGTDEGHFINENTIVRLAEAAKVLRKELGGPDWYESNDPNTVYFVVLCHFRDCIIHYEGRNVTEAEFDKMADNKYDIRKNEYIVLCRNLHISPFGNGNEKLCLTAQPVIETLLKGMIEFTKSLT
jgi:hypothetical protein